MRPYFEAPDTRLYHGDVRAVLRGLEPESVHCVVTSPPYWALRRYECPDAVWGGAPLCEHPWIESGFCQSCGAWRGQLGQEPDPDLYVEHVIEVCREIKRVLRRDGTFFLNVADSYAGSGQGWQSETASSYERKWLGEYGRGPTASQAITREGGIRAKSLCLIPERLSLALLRDGWVIRSRIAWIKLCPMPESVEDRPTGTWEHIWMLGTEENYYFDAVAVREESDPAQEFHNRRYARPYAVSDGKAGGRQPGNTNNVGIHSRPGPGGRNQRNAWVLPPEPSTWNYCLACGSLWQGPGRSQVKKVVRGGKAVRLCPCGATDQWVDHYAVFPSEIPRRAILAGSSEHGVCADCGSPWRRVTVREKAERTQPRAFAKAGNGDRQDTGRVYEETQVRTVGWEPTCKCKTTRVVPATVLDPFLGSGTSAIVARQLGRNFVGIDLSERYLSMAVRRLEAQTPSLFGALAAG